MRCGVLHVVIRKRRMRIGVECSLTRWTELLMSLVQNVNVVSKGQVRSR